MNHLDYLKRLGLQGGRLLWRVLMILGPVVGYSLWQMIKARVTHDPDEEPTTLIASRAEAWEAFDKGQIGAADMAYYDEIYGK